MVIICLIICDINGNVIFARQFLPIFSKSELFSQSLIFIKNYKNQSELKYFDIHPYRYLFQILNNDLFLLLITKLENNNIILELEILSICHRILQQRIKSNIIKDLIKKEGLNLSLDLDEFIQNGMAQNLKLGEINSKINMIRVDKKEIKEKIKQKIKKLKSLMITQYKEWEKIEQINNNIQKFLNFDEIDESKTEKNGVRPSGLIRINITPGRYKIKKPIVFKTPSEKVILYTEQKKIDDSRKDKKIKGLKLLKK